jgi:hypothetical protein
MSSLYTRPCYLTNHPTHPGWINTHRITHRNLETASTPLHQVNCVTQVVMGGLFREVVTYIRRYSLKRVIYKGINTLYALRLGEAVRVSGKDVC